MNTGNGGKRRLRSFVVGVLAVTLLSGAGTSRGATVVGDGWTTMRTEGTVAYAFPAAGSVSIRFPNTLTPDFSAGTLVPTSAGSSGPFNGNYRAAMARSLSFTITGAGTTPAASRVVLRSGKLEWSRLGLDISAQAGTPVLNRVSLDRVAGGWVTTARGDLDQLWRMTLENVDLVGIGLVKKTKCSGVQQFTVSGFTLDSDRSVGSLTPLEEALYSRFGLIGAPEIVAAGLDAIDSNGNGMTDLNETLAEYDPAYFAQNLFKIRIGGEASGFKVTWACVVNKGYTLYRARSIEPSTRPEDGWQSVYSNVAAQTGYMQYVDVDAQAGMHYFYKVIQQP
jgi:hypothetical protein